MRNVFDQYAQPENRLTHALASSLAEDPKLLRAFVRWVCGSTKNIRGGLEIVEQQLPGDVELSEDEVEHRGLPDAWIHSGEEWSLLIECKVASPLSNDQLRRHQRTAIRRGFSDVTLLAIDVAPPRRKLPEGVMFRQWSDVYEWLVKMSATSEWAGRAAKYLEIAEGKMSDEGYLKEGTLTVFSGLPFGSEEPYSYPEAKRLLKLAMDELRQRKDLVRQLGMDADGPGRGAITGIQGVAVWDFLRLQGAPDTFTKYPHLTLSVQSDRLVTIVAVPNSIQQNLRKRITELGFDGFCEMMAEINANLEKGLRSCSGAVPWVEVVQRHYPSQRSVPILDAKIEFDLRTAFAERAAKHKVKPQPQWLSATFEAFKEKKSNLQLAVGAIFPYRTCPATRERRILTGIANTWIACKPLLRAMGVRK